MAELADLVQDQSLIELGNAAIRKIYEANLKGIFPSEEQIRNEVAALMLGCDDIIVLFKKKKKKKKKKKNYFFFCGMGVFEFFQRKSSCFRMGWKIPSYKRRT